MPYYLSKDKEHDKNTFKANGWTEIAALCAQDSIRITDLVTIHPSQSVSPDRRRHQRARLRHAANRPRRSGQHLPTLKLVRASRAAWPPMPTINGEVCYEGILGTCYDDVQRFMVWSCLLSGTAGHTYGANGIWQLNRPGQPYGLSPHGGTWGATPWNEAMNLPGSTADRHWPRQLSRMLPGRKFEPHPEWASLSNLERCNPGTWKSWIWYAEGQPASDAPRGRALLSPHVRAARRTNRSPGPNCGPRPTTR